MVVWVTRGENVRAVMNLSPAQREMTLAEYTRTRCNVCGVAGCREVRS